jgi:mannose-6-phosphate isomerase-like protein (cupin superfamily)
MRERSWIAHEDECPWEDDVTAAGEGGTPLRWRVLLSAGRTPSRGLTLGVLEVPPGAALAAHRHQPCEAYYVTEGGAEVYDGERWVPVKQSDVAYWRGDHPHGIRNRGGETCKMVWVFPVDSYEAIEYVED